MTALSNKALLEKKTLSTQPTFSTSGRHVLLSNWSVHMGFVDRVITHAYANPASVKGPITGSYIIRHHHTSASPLGDVCTQPPVVVLTNTTGQGNFVRRKNLGL